MCPEVIIMSMDTIVTIGRQTGSGGREIGEKVAKELGVPYYEKKLLDLAAEKSGLSREFFETHDEKRVSSFLYSLVMDSPTPGFSNTMSGMPINHKSFLAQFETIKELAQKGGCVIIGRCADYALEENPHMLSVFVHADYDFRVKRIMQEYNVSETKAREIINKTDKSRSQYYNYYTGRKWGVASNYHVALDSARFGIDETVEIICSMAKIKHNRDIQQ